MKVSKITAPLEMSSDEVNEILGGMDDRGFFVPGLMQHGKSLPYIGWYWRHVDFDQPIKLGDCGSFIGFIESNKWGYPQWHVTAEQAEEIRRQVRDIASSPTQEKLQAFYEYIQTCTPEGYEGFDAAMREEERHLQEILSRPRVSGN